MSLEELVRRLRAAGCVFAEEEARLLLAAPPERREALVEQRCAGLPLEHVLGWAEFAGLRVDVDASVFVPRRRTELLVAEAAALAGAGAVVVDMCCGSGAVGAALLDRVPGIDLHAADVDPAAVRCARRNLDPARVHEGDLLDALPGLLRGRVDLLVANAPYVPSDAVAMMPPEARLHEPRIALDGGADGLDVHRRLAAGAATWLVPGGHLLVETSEEQAAVAADAFAASGMRTRVAHSADLAATVVLGTLPPPPIREFRPTHP